MPRTKYVIDSCSLIKPHKTIYRMNVVPSFWNTMRERILSGEIIICEKVYDEICLNRDALSSWLKSIVDGTTLVAHVDSDILNNVSIIVNNVNSHIPPYKVSAISTFNGCADPFVVATAKALNCSMFDNLMSNGFNSIELLINLNSFGFKEKLAMQWGQGLTNLTYLMT